MFRTENECMKTCQLPEINPEKNPESNPEINPEIKTEINPKMNPDINSKINLKINPEINPVIKPLEDICNLEADPGPCLAYRSRSHNYRRYYFDKNDQKCKIFTFSGCRGKVHK